MKRVSLALILVISCLTAAFSQDNDRVLFTVDGVPVYVSEFKYIYSKTNSGNADFSKSSLEEYLDLYTKFKLKVKRARDMQLDTIPSLMAELGQYRKQLADSYLIDREVTDKLIEEAYERSKKDVDISHIMVSVGENASPEDTLNAYNKIVAARKELMAGKSVSDVAMEYSDDRSKEQNKGHIGFITALFPNGLYALETAAYNQKDGEVSQPVRTRMGYHLIKTNSFRDARGEIEAAHILIRKPKDEDNKNIKSRIDSIYNELKKGADFEELAKKLSEDHLSADKGGYLGFFGINRYEKEFEDAAFALKNDGDFSAPVETSLGWHIIKRISKKGIEPFNIAKVALQNKVKNDARFELARLAMIEKIKRNNNFTEHPEVLEEFIASQDSNFLSFRWKPHFEEKNKILFEIGDTKATVGEFEDFLVKESRKRIRMAGGDNETAARVLYSEFIEDQCLKHEERHLEEKYPDFKSLMREYEEGILLFEATKMEVWDKASQDSTGLAEFFKTIEGKYKWNQRAVVSVYTLNEEAKDQLEEVRVFAANNPPDKVMVKFNPEDKTLLTRVEKTFEKGKNEVLDRVRWETGAITNTEVNTRDKSMSFMKIEEILPPSDKELDEARGYVVADYQDYLEKEWIEKLKKEYEVEINRKVFESLIKK